MRLLESTMEFLVLNTEFLQTSISHQLLQYLHEHVNIKAFLSGQIENFLKQADNLVNCHHDDAGILY